MFPGGEQTAVALGAEADDAATVGRGEGVDGLGKAALPFEGAVVGEQGRDGLVGLDEFREDDPGLLVAVAGPEEFGVAPAAAVMMVR